MAPRPRRRVGRRHHAGPDGFGSTSSLPFVPTRSLREADAAFAEASALEFRPGKGQARRRTKRWRARGPRVRATALKARGPAAQSGISPARCAPTTRCPRSRCRRRRPAGRTDCRGWTRERAADRNRSAELRDAAPTCARSFRGRWPLTAPEFELSNQASAWLGTPRRPIRMRWPAPTPSPGCGNSERPSRRQDARSSHSRAAPRSSCGVRPATVSKPSLAAQHSWGRSCPQPFRRVSRPACATRTGTMSWERLRGPRRGHAGARRGVRTLQISPGPSGASPIDELPTGSCFCMGVMVVVLGAGWYFIARARARELRVARLQNDFVASVSHEFRSPLTSLAHISELLAQNRLPTDAQRQKAYDVLVADTARLRDLVEHLLDFGRFDSGTIALRFERVGIDAMVRGHRRGRPATRGGARVHHRLLAVRRSGRCRGGPRRARARDLEPDRQRGEVLAGLPDRVGGRRTVTRVERPSRSVIRVSASRPASRRGSSSASSAARKPSRAASRAPASAWLSCGKSWTRTAARSN